MIKIGFDAKKLFNNVSGLGNYSRNTVELLSEFYPENEYHLFTPEKSDEIVFPELKNVHEHYPEGHWNFGVLKSVWHSYGILSDLKDLGIDIFHGLTNEMPFQKPEKHIKTVVTVHDLIFESHPEYYNPVDKVIYEATIKNATRISDIVIAVSNKTKERLIEDFKIDEGKIRVVHQSCHSSFFNTVSPEQRDNVRLKYNLPTDFILSVGTIEKRKNVLAILKAMKVGKIDLPLVIIGQPTKYLDLVIDYISKNNLKRQVIILHSVDRGELPAIYQLAKLFMYVSKVEGFGIPVVEAMACGTPVISSLGTAMEEAGGEGALYVDSDDEESIANGMLNILNDDQLRSDIKNKQRIEIERYQYGKIIQQLNNVYKELL